MNIKLLITGLLLFNFTICFSQKKISTIKTNKKSEISAKEIEDRIKILQAVLLCRGNSTDRCVSDHRWNNCSDFNEYVETSSTNAKERQMTCIQGLPGGGVLLQYIKINREKIKEIKKPKGLNKN